MVILVLGDDRVSCAETHDRVSMDLPGSQLILLQSVLNVTGNLVNASLPPDWGWLGIKPYARPGGPIPVVVVLIHSRPMTFDNARGNWLQPGLASTGASALLAAWQPSEQGGFAIVDVITGRVNPSGHLAQGWLRSTGHVRSPGGPYIQQPNSQGSGPWFEPSDNVVGPSGLGTWEPLFPFAHGLSYTTFELTEMSVSPSGVVPINPSGTLNVTVQLVNTGKVDGTALVQVYVNVRVANVVRYVNKLAGWSKVFVAAGESVPVTVAVKQSDLDRWDGSAESSFGPSLPGDWVIDAGNYTLSAGLCWSSSLYAKQSALFPCSQLSQTVTLA